MSLFICAISALFWSFFDLTRKLCLKKTSPQILLLIFSFSQIIIFSFWCLIATTNILINEYLWLGLFLIIINIISAIFFLKSLTLSDISMTIPLLSFSPLFSAFFSYLLLSESINFFQYVGIFLIMFGTMLLYTRSLNFKDLVFSLTLIFSDKGAKYMLFVSLIWSITPIFDKLCFKYASFNIHGFIQALGMFLILTILEMKKEKIFPQIKQLSKDFKLLSITMLVGTIATILQFFAISLAFVPIMESMKRSIGQIGAVIYGKYIFNEKVTIKKILGIFIISFGTFFVLLF